MTVTNITKDRTARKLTVTAVFAAPVERVWELWADPRQLERWWGPPSCPAQVVDHELSPGGRVTYAMALPDGTTSKGWWHIHRVERPRLLEFQDGFANDDWSPNTDLPVSEGRVVFADEAGVTSMVIETTFPSLDDMDRLIAMGMEDGMAAALGQIDDLLRAEVPS